MKNNSKRKQTPVILVKDLTMEFRMPVQKPDSLKEYLILRMKGSLEEQTLKALKRVSFQVDSGEVLGIVGTNGSGKSTLLKLISGALSPTRGTINVSREVHLLTLGTGFDRELTARENVYLNGALLGFTRQELREKYKEIVQFAELEGYMDQKIKNFSSGMVSRLGFSIATARETTGILILDEVLSVGDPFFREKSEKRIRELMHSGQTVLLVSHSMSAVLKNCSRVLWLEKGILKMQGDPRTVCDAYLEYGKSQGRAGG